MEDETLRSSDEDVIANDESLEDSKSEPKLLLQLLPRNMEKRLPSIGKTYKRKSSDTAFPNATSKITNITLNTVKRPTICYQIYDETGKFRMMQYTFSAESFWKFHEE